MSGPHIWRTLGYRRTDWRPGATRPSMDRHARATAFPPPTALSSRVGWSPLSSTPPWAERAGPSSTSTRCFSPRTCAWSSFASPVPGLLSATGTVWSTHPQEVVFCAAEMHDADGVLLASSRCTQVVLPNAGPFGRHGYPWQELGAPPQDTHGSRRTTSPSSPRPQWLASATTMRSSSRERRTGPARCTSGPAASPGASPTSACNRATALWC